MIYQQELQIELWVSGVWTGQLSSRTQPQNWLLMWICYLEQSDKRLQECLVLTDGFNDVPSSGSRVSSVSSDL